MFSFVLFGSLGCFLVWCLAVLGWLGSFGLLGFFSKEYFFKFSMDEISGVCCFMLFCCGSLALFYCYHYFSGSQDGGLLYFLLIWFLMTMAVLIFSSSLLFTLVFWEYLGLVSFFLILFYSNSPSLRASLVTLFASRFGDVALFVLVGWLVSWFDSLAGHLFMILSVLIIMTKSACYPFVSWLLEAMRAPTPVSSLVHSSTLVAAGVWFLFRYDNFWGAGVYSTLFSFSLLTIVLTGFCASFFNDLKKLVALSTCNNVSWCLVFFICGDLGLALLQLLCHGVSKCYLFMSVGDLMSCSGGSQSAVGVYSSRYAGLFGSLLQVLLILSLSGLPFLGVFFSKHGLFSEVFYSCGVGSLFVMCVGFFLTYVYSVRFVFLLVGNLGGLSSGYSSGFLMIALVSFLGTILNFWGVTLFDELVELGSLSGGGLLILQGLGCLMGVILFFWGGHLNFFWESVLWGSDCFVNWFYEKFLPSSRSFYLSFYRWELYFLGLFGDGLGGFSGVRFSLFSLNFMVCCLFFILLFVFFVGF